jgi:hypothetical protein
MQEIFPNIHSCLLRRFTQWLSKPDNAFLASGGAIQEILVLYNEEGKQTVGGVRACWHAQGS